MKQNKTQNTKWPKLKSKNIETYSRQSTESASPPHTRIIGLDMQPGSFASSSGFLAEYPLFLTNRSRTILLIEFQNLVAHTVNTKARNRVVPTIAPRDRPAGETGYGVELLADLTDNGLAHGSGARKASVETFRHVDAHFILDSVHDGLDYHR
jgi:hypothetical protein